MVEAWEELKHDHLVFLEILRVDWEHSLHGRSDLLPSLEEGDHHPEDLVLELDLVGVLQVLEQWKELLLDGCEELGDELRQLHQGFYRVSALRDDDVGLLATALETLQLGLDPCREELDDVSDVLLSLVGNELLVVPIIFRWGLGWSLLDDALDYVEVQGLGY